MQCLNNRERFGREGFVNMCAFGRFVTYMTDLKLSTRAVIFEPYVYEVRVSVEPRKVYASNNLHGGLIFLTDFNRGNFNS